MRLAYTSSLKLFAIVPYGLDFRDDVPLKFACGMSGMCYQSNIGMVQPSVNQLWYILCLDFSRSNDVDVTSDML